MLFKYFKIMEVYILIDISVVNLLARIRSLIKTNASLIMPSLFPRQRIFFQISRLRQSKTLLGRRFIYAFTFFFSLDKEYSFRTQICRFRALLEYLVVYSVQGKRTTKCCLWYVPTKNLLTSTIYQTTFSSLSTVQTIWNVREMKDHSKLNFPLWH